MPQSILQDPLLLTRLKWSEIVDVLCLEVLGETRRDPLSMRRVSVPGDEALCITLRRLAYPNRLRDLEHLFARDSSTISSLTNEVLRHIEDNFFHLLDDVNNHTWLNLDTLEEFSQAVHAKGAPLTNCWAFIDGTAQPICRPTRNQKVYFSGHKRVHALKYQAIMCPNGIICQLDGSYPGSKHDSGNFGNSAAYTKLQNLVQGHDCCIYGDPAYPLRPLLLKPYGGALLTPEQLAFNKAMSSVSQYFGLEPPQLEVYLAHK
nr:protein ALP1-like [Rhipicephalus microplus]